MSKYAWVEGGIIRDLTRDEPGKVFVPAVAALYAQIVPNSARQGDGWDGLVLTPAITPAPVQPPVPGPTKFSITDFNFLFTVTERIAIRASADSSLVDYLRLLNDPRYLEVDLTKEYIKDYLDLLKTLNLITNPRKNKILSGHFPNDPIA